MTKSSRSKNSGNGNWYDNQALVLTLIGVGGTIIAALISIAPQIVQGLRKPEPTQTSIPVTATVLVEPTYTSIPTETIIPPTEILSPTPTQTASPSPTPTSITPPISCLDRWQIISSDSDLTETSTAGDCAQASVPALGISASGSGISIGVNNFREQGEFGIATSLPTDATISLSVSLTVLTQGEFWVALSNTPKPENNLYVLAYQPKSGDEFRTYIDQTSSYSEKYKYKDVTSNTIYTSGPPYIYNITFTTSGNKVNTRIHFTDLPSQFVNLPKYLFIGYSNKSTLGSMSLQAEITDLTIEIK